MVNDEVFLSGGLFIAVAAVQDHLGHFYKMRLI